MMTSGDISGTSLVENANISLLACKRAIRSVHSLGDKVVPI